MYKGKNDVSPSHLYNSMHFNIIYLYYFISHNIDKLKYDIIVKCYLTYFIFSNCFGH